MVDLAAPRLAESGALGSRFLQLLLLTAAAAAAMYARTAVSPVQETMRVAFNLTDNQMALLQGPALALPLTVATIPLGLLIDRYSRARLLMIFGALSLIGTWFTAFADSFALLFAARCLVGLTATATGTAAFSLIADLYRPVQRGRATLALAMGQFGGTSAAFALGGWLLALTGNRPGDWRVTMLWLSVPLVVVSVLMLAMREPTRLEVTTADSSIPEAFRGLWLHRGAIGPLLTALVMIEVAFQSVLVWAAPTLARNYDLSPDRIGVIMATGLMISGILGPIAGGIAADLSQHGGGPRRTLCVLSVLALITVPAALFSSMPGAASATGLLVTFMATACAVLVMGTALFTIVVPNELRGFCMATFTSATLVVGVGLGPVGVSHLSGAMGGPTTIGNALSIVCACAGVLAAGVFALGGRQFKEAP